MAFLKGSLAGPGYVILNAVRALNIIALLDIIAADAVLLAKISQMTSFFFFEAVTHTMSAIVCAFLITSELPIFRSYFDRNWPLMGQYSGFTALAVAMMVLGASILGNLNAKATSQVSLGVAFWRLILSAGILAMVMSAVNVILSYVFMDRKMGISARHVRIYGAVASQKVVPQSVNSSQASPSSSLKREDPLSTYNPLSSTRRQPLSQNSTRLLVRVSESTPPKNDAASSRYSRDSSGITVPSLAYHPAMRSGHV